MSRSEDRRFPLLTEATMTPRQRESYQKIVSGPRKGASGPFNALLRSPEVADRVQQVGEYVRFQTTIPRRAQRDGHPDHRALLGRAVRVLGPPPAGPAAGPPRAPSSTRSRRGGARPPMSDDQRVVYDFCSELFRDRAVSDAAFKAVVDRFGDQGVIDLIAAAGYYSIVSMVLNVDRYPLPAGEEPPLKPI